MRPTGIDKTTLYEEGIKNMLYETQNKLYFVDAPFHFDAHKANELFA